MNPTISKYLMQSRVMVDGHIVIDNATLETFTACPRMFYHYAVLGRELNSTRSALSFGQAIHSALEFRYRMAGNKAPSVNVETEMKRILYQHFMDNPVQPDDHRTADYAVQVIDRYNLQYEDEPFEILPHPDGLLVERPFAIPLGSVENIPVIWTGRIDLGVRWSDGRISPFDHKTTSMFGPFFFDEFINSQAQIGYCWALKQSFPKEDVSSYGINAIVCRKPTATGKGIELQRQVLYLDSERLEEWRQNVLYIIEDILKCDHRDNFPMHFKSCTLKYGRCQYLDVCSVQASARPAVIHSTQFRDVDWSPIKVPQ